MREWPNPDLRRKLERQVASLAAAIVAGRAPLVGSTQRMAKLLYQLGLREVDPAVRAFAAIRSETVHLPLGPERQYWEPAALARKDEEIAEKEAWARGFGLEACRQLVERFGSDERAT
jgi:hypothetical protein